MKTNYPTQDYTEWNLPERTEARIGDGYINGKIVYSPDGTQLVVPKSTGIWVYDTSTFEVIDFINEHRAFDSTEIRNNQWCELIEVDNAVGFSSEGNLFAVRVAWQDCVWPKNSEIYTIRIWSRKTEQPERISIECPEKIDSMALSPDGSTLAGSKDGTIYLWNVDTGELRNTITVGSKKIKSMVFSPNGATLASSSWMGTGQFITSVSEGQTYESRYYYIDVWDTCTGRHKFSHNQADAPLVFSPDGRTLANSIADGFSIIVPTIELSDVETGIQKFCLEVGSTLLAFSPDGHILASFSANKIQLWELYTENRKLAFTGTGNITSLVFSPDGFTFAGGCEDGTVLLWDIVSQDNNAINLKEKVDYHEYLKSDRWQRLRKSVLLRDNELCICGAKATEVHHKTYARVGHEIPSDLVSLCRSCHQNVHDNHQIG